MDTGLLPTLAKAATEERLLTQIYGDLAKPGVTQVGRALAAVFGLGNTILWPIHLLNGRAQIALEANLEQYREKMSHVPVDEVVEVAPEIGVPIADKLSYLSDQDLRELYTNLLVKASTSETQSLAHPSFVNILNNMSPDEAMFICNLNLRNEQIPFSSAKFINESKNQWIQVVDLHFLSEIYKGLRFPENTSAYASNLDGLGIIQIRRDIFVVPESIYSPIEDELTMMLNNHTRPNGFPELKFDKGKVEFTQFGRLFINACVS